MIGSILKDLLKERKISANELATKINVSSQTLYSIMRRDNNKVDFDLLLKICDELQVPLDVFANTKKKNAFELSVAESDLINSYRKLDEHSKLLVSTVIGHESSRKVPELKLVEPVKVAQKRTKTIPLYLTAAAAGFASPVIGEDYEEYEVMEESPADFAVRIDGDSMEPYIKDKSIVLVRRGETIVDGDVGLFFADTGMVCKQYCQDYVGNVYLFSLNRKRSDADVFIGADSDASILCFGKVLMDKAVALPSE